MKIDLQGRFGKRTIKVFGKVNFIRLFLMLDKVTFDENVNVLERRFIRFIHIYRTFMTFFPKLKILKFPFLGSARAFNWEEDKYTLRR